MASAADQAYAFIHEGIVSGDLPAGSHLREEDLADQIGVSRTRSSPNSSINPFDTWNIPPVAPTSSPMRNTLSSRAIS